MFGYVLKDGLHCQDLWPGDKEGEKSMQIWYKALDKWLACFEPTWPDEEEEEWGAMRNGRSGSGKGKRMGKRSIRGASDARRW